MILAALLGSAVLAGCAQPDPSPEELRAQYCEDFAADSVRPGPGGFSDVSGKNWLNTTVVSNTQGSGAEGIPVEVRAKILGMLPSRPGNDGVKVDTTTLV